MQQIIGATPSSQGGGARYAWAIVGMLWLVCFFNYADRMAVFSVFPVLEKQFHFTKAQLALIGTAFSWVYGAMAPFAGHVGDRNPRKLVVLGGLAVWSVITGLTAQCSRLWHFVAVRGAEGLGETFYFPASMALISDYHTPATRSRAIGLHQTSIYAGTICGGAVAGWMAQDFGWQSPFWALAAAGVLLSLILARYIREPQRNQAERALMLEPASANGEHQAPALRFIADLVHTPTAMLLLAAYFGANMVMLIFLTWTPTYLNERFGKSVAVSAVEAVLFIQVASIVGAAVGGAAADHFVRQRTDGRIRVQAAAIVMAVPVVFACGRTPVHAVLLLSLLLFGFFKGIYDSNLTAAYYDVIHPDRRGTATGIMNMLGWLAAGLGTLLFGIAVDHGVTMGAAISSTAVVYVLVAVALLAAGRTVSGDIRPLLVIPTGGRNLASGTERPDSSLSLPRNTVDTEY